MPGRYDPAMSSTSPVDDESAGLRRAWTLPDAEALAVELGLVLRRLDPAVPPTAREAAARSLAPLVGALALLRADPRLGPWDGLLHRRAVLAPAPPDDGGGDAGALRVDRTARGGWGLIRAEAVLGGWTVRHELARCTAAQPVATAGRGTDGARRVRPQQADAGATGAALVRAAVTPETVLDWAVATGDDNALHIRPGAALAAGLPVGERDVVAHGLLTAAISLLARPTGAQGCDLRFTAPVAVAHEGALLEADAEGTVSLDGTAVLRRA